MTGKRINVLAEAVSQLRTGRDWSQEDLAREAGVTRSWIKKLELSQMKTPGADKLARIARALGIDPRRLLDLAGIALPEDSLSLHPERFDPAVVRLAEDLQALPESARQEAVRVCQAYVIMQRSLGTPAARKLMESLKRPAQEGG